MKKPELTDSQKTDQALEQYRRRQLGEYEHMVKEVVGLSAALGKAGWPKAANVAARAAVMLAEVYVARREGQS